MSRVREVGVGGSGGAPQGAGGGGAAAWGVAESVDAGSGAAGRTDCRLAGGVPGCGREGLKSRPAPEGERRLVDAQRKVGELQLEVDILRALLEKKGEPSVAEALEVSETRHGRGGARPRRCRHRWGRSAGRRAWPGRRRTSSAAAGASRLRRCLLADVPARSGRSPTPSSWPRYGWIWSFPRSSVRATARSGRGYAASAASAPAASACCASPARRGCSPRTPQVRKRSQRLHEGTITVEVPNTLWRPTRPRRGRAARLAARCSCSSTTP